MLIWLNLCAEGLETRLQSEACHFQTNPWKEVMLIILAINGYYNNNNEVHLSETLICGLYFNALVWMFHYKPHIILSDKYKDSSTYCLPSLCLQIIIKLYTYCLGLFQDS